MVKVAVDARHDLHPRGAQITLLHIGAEGRGQIVRVLTGLIGEPDRVLRGHASALRQILQHGMGGVAEQRDPPLAPLLHRFAVAQHPHAPRLDALEHAQDLGALAFKMGPQLARIGLRIPTLDVTLGVEHGDQVVNFGAAQRVVDEMGARASPQDHVRRPEILRHLLAREHGAISDMARYQRLAVADHLVAHLRPHAVAADEGTASDAFARLQGHADAGVVLLEILDAATGFQRDAVVVLARIDEDGMQIVAVSDGVGLLELLPKARLIERDAGDALAGQGAAHLHGGRPVCVGKHRLFEVEFFERAKDVGAELDAGADLVEFGRLLQHPHGETLARERVGRRQAPDAAARNQDRQGLTVRHRSSTNVRIFSP